MVTLLESLPLDDYGHILVPVAAVAVRDDGTEVELPGHADVESVKALFGAYCELDVPLTDEAYDALLRDSTPVWRRNWQRWRAEGRI